MEVLSVNNIYASGFRRLVAWFIDKMVVGFILGILLWNPWDWNTYSDYDWWLNRSNFHFTFLSHKALKLLVVMLYYAAMESSKFQGTIGKLALGIKVTDVNGERITFSKALLRNLSKIISGVILMIGYLMILFDSKKQGLHDKIADTYVVKS